MAAVFQEHIQMRKGKNIVTTKKEDAQVVWAALQEKYKDNMTREIAAFKIRKALTTYSLDDGWPKTIDVLLENWEA